MDGRGERPLVLMVDDEEMNLRAYQRVFRHDFRIAIAASVAEGIVLAERVRFDVAVVDYAMPVATGLELFRFLAEHSPETGRLMVTGHADLAEVRASVGAGLTHAVVMKPWERDIILRWVRNYLTMSSLRRTVGSMHGVVGRRS